MTGLSTTLPRTISQLSGRILLRPSVRQLSAYRLAIRISTANEVADEEGYQFACKWVSPWILLQMKNLLFGLYRQRNSRIRKEIPLFICGEWKHTSMTDVCVIDENGSLSSLLPKRCCSVQQSFRKFSWCGSPRRQSDGRNHDDWHIPNIFQDSCHLGTDRSGEYPTAPTVVAMPS